MGARRGSQASIRHFAYLNARVQAMRGRLLPSDTYSKLLQMEIPQIARFLGETEYKSEIELLAKRYRGVDLVEYALNRNLSTTLHGLLGKAQYELRDLLELYLRRYDLENVTTILRGKLSGATAEELREALIPAGKLRTDQLEALVVADREGTLDLLRTMGQEHVVDALADKPLPEVEDMMRRRYYAELLEATKAGGRSMELLRRFLRTEVDFRNLTNLLRLKRDGESPETIKSYMIEGGLELGPKELGRLSSMEFDAVLREVERMPYFRGGAQAIKDASDSLVALEAAMTREGLRWASKQARVNPLTILVALSYILAKQVEVDNIRSIVRGKEGALPLDIIRRTLVA